MKKTLRRTLALILSLIMIIGVVQVGFVFSSAASAKSSSVTCGDLQFVVPEAIYLYPEASSLRATTATPFQYYINNNKDGTAQTAYDKTGKIYYSYATASNAEISYRFVGRYLDSQLTGGSVTLSATSGLGTSKTIDITEGKSPNLESTIFGCYIEWTLSFTDTKDNVAKKAYAYTYVYKPFVDPVACSARSLCSRKWTYSFRGAGAVTWISGIQSITEGSSLADSDLDETYFEYTDDATFAAFISADNTGYIGGTAYTGSQAKITSGFTTAPSSTGGSLGYCVFTNGTSSYKMKTNWSNAACDDMANGGASYTNQAKNLTEAHYEKTGEKNVQVCYANNSVGNIYVDISRYSNLNQVPNLGVGLVTYDDQNTDSNHGTWYIADFSGRTLNVSAKSGYNTYHTGSDSRGTYWSDKGTVIAAQSTGATDTKYSETEGIRYAGKYPKATPESITTQGQTADYMVKGFFGTNSDDDSGEYPSSHTVVKLQAKYYNKANLRAAVNNAIKKMPALGITGESTGIGKPTSCYFDDDTNYKWTAFQTAFQAACKALGTLDAKTYNYGDPDTLATNLNTALANLCTKVTFNANGGTLSSTTDVYVTIGTNQTKSYTPTYTGTRTGYTLQGWSTSASGPASSSVTVGYNNTVYAIWEPITYTVKYNGNGATSGSTESSSHTYDTAKNLTANGFTKGVTVTFNANGGTCSTASLPSNYSFLGWADQQTEMLNMQIKKA